MEKYHVTQLDKSFFKVTWNGFVSGRKVNILGRFTYEGISLKTLLSQARNRISAGVINEGKKSGFKATFSTRDLVWDEDLSDLQPIFAKQSDNKAEGVHMVASSLNELTHVMAQKKEAERLFEIKKVNNVWTVIKHDAPLLSWSEATEILKTKVC